MGLFSTVKYSQIEHELTEHEVKHHLNNVAIPAFQTHPEREKLVQDTILARRHGDGKISLQQIYELLTHEKDAGQITIYDRDAIMRVMQELYSHKGV